MAHLFEMSKLLQASEKQNKSDETKSVKFTILIKEIELGLEDTRGHLPPVPGAAH